MDEYIKRSDAINAIKSLESSMPAKDNYAKGYDAALGRTLIAVREVPPAIDVQPVVRCKDCKHRTEHHYENIGEQPYIKYGCKFTKYSMSDEGFCSFGVRMDRAQDDRKGG